MGISWDVELIYDSSNILKWDFMGYKMGIRKITPIDCNCFVFVEYPVLHQLLSSRDDPPSIRPQQTLLRTLRPNI